MQLATFTQGRNNNFNLIRLVAALVVLANHSIILVHGIGYSDPIRVHLGMSLGAMAVDVFFITSGFLVTASLLNRRSTAEFLIARGLRIYPALVVMVILTVFVLGAYFTTLPIQAYLSDPATRGYLLSNSTLVRGVAWTLPGVFESVPYKTAVNGSLWTLPYEIKMYGLLAGAWLAFRIVGIHRSQALRWLIVGAAGVSVAMVIARHLQGIATGEFLRFFSMFFSGAAYYVLREHIVLSKSIFVLVLTLLLVSALHQSTFSVIYPLACPYLLFFAAYVPDGWIRAYNRVGDYSYGVYIYAFPIQQALIELLPGSNGLENAALSTVVTIIFAILSWHLIEERALKLKQGCVGIARHLMSFGGRRMAHR